MKENETHNIDLSAPMPSAPIRFNEDGSVAWGDMWDSYCVLATAGGPAHRETLLQASDTVDPTSHKYQSVVAELVRGVKDVSGLEARAADEAGWLAIKTESTGMANWLAEQIVAENVEARAKGVDLLVPVAEHYTLQGEIKNVITVVAKTSHYWKEHLASEVKRAMNIENLFAGIGQKLRGFFGRK